MPLPVATRPSQDFSLGVPPRLWLYTNYDCNLACTYCVAESHPHAERRGLPLETARRVIDEAVDLGFTELFITGGEPFILPGIFELLAFALDRVHTTVLSNGVALRGARLARLLTLPQERLTLQISLDGASPETNDAYRGAGSWQKAITAIQTLKTAGCHVRLGTTITPENAGALPELCALHRRLAIPDEDHVVRPLVRRGFSVQGMALSLPTLLPELTVNRDGVYWHPVATDDDLLITPRIFPFAAAVQQVTSILAAVQDVTEEEARAFT